MGLSSTLLMEEELFKAAVSGDLSIISEANINRHGCSYFTDHTTPKNNNIIHVAAEFDQYMFVEKALEVFPELIFRNNIDKDTPLHVAARNGNQKTVEVLISWSGCATEEQSNGEEDWLWMTKNSQGDTPLHLALSSNELNVAMVLLKVGSVKALSLLNDSQETPLHIFLRYCYSGTNTTASALLEEGVLNLQGLYNKAQGDGIGTRIQGSSGSIIKNVLVELVKYKPAMYICDVKGLTPLLIAAQKGCFLAVQLIVSCCPLSAEVSDPQGRSVLHLMKKNQPLVVKYAWEVEADDFPSSTYKELKELLNIPEINALKNKKDYSGNTPAHAAVEGQAFVLVRVLMECFANFTIKNKNGVSALDMLTSLPDFSLKMEELRVLENLTSKTMDKELMEAASINGDVSLFKKRGERDVESGEIIYDDDYFLSQTPEGYNILHLAVRKGHLEFVVESFKLFPILVLTTDCSGETPLHCAARLKNNHLVPKTLLQLSKDRIDKFTEKAGDKFLCALPWRMKNIKGNSPLHEAIFANNYDIAIALMRTDPMLSSFQNKTGQTPLHLLARYGECTRRDNLGDLIKMLMGKNCSLTASLRDTDGFTPLMRAAYCGRFQVVYHIVKNCPASVMCRDPNGRIFLHYLKVVSNAEMDTINAMIYAFGSILPNLTTEGLRSTQDCDGNTPLHLALKENNFAAAKFLLLCCSKEQVRTELYITNNNGQSVLDLLEALADNNLDVKELKDLVLLGQSKALGIKVMEKEVYEAAVNGNVSLFESHDDGATADDATSEEVGSGCFDVQISGSYDDSRFLSRTPGGSNILHIAFQYGNSFRFCNEAIKRYPELLFDIDCNGDSPVHIAAKFCGGSTIEYIETHYRKFCHEPFVYPWRVKNSKGNTPLHEAVQSISSGASGDLIRVDPESALCVNDAGETPLHLFARRSRDTGFIENVFCYEEGRSSAYIRDKEGLTPLLRAAKSGRLEVVQSILNNCPGSIHVRDLNGRSFLHLLHFHRYKLDGMEIESCEIPGVDFLRSVQDFDGNTPLMSSIKDGNPLAAKYIIQRFTQSSYREMCDHVEVLNNDGQSIFDVLALHDDAPNEVRPTSQFLCQK